MDLLIQDLPSTVYIALNFNVLMIFNYFTIYYWYVLINQWIYLSYNEVRIKLTENKNRSKFLISVFQVLNYNMGIYVEPGNHLHTNIKQNGHKFICVCVCACVKCKLGVSKDLTIENLFLPSLFQTQEGLLIGC